MGMGLSPPPLALPGALPVPLLPDAWHAGRCRLGLPTAGQAPSLGAGAAAQSTQRAAGAPWHRFGSVGSTWDAPTPAPARSGSEQGQSHCGGHRAEGGGQPRQAAPSLPLPPALGSEAGALVVQPAELGEATVPAVRVPAGTPCQSPAPCPTTTAAAAGAAAAGAAAAAPVLVDGDLNLGPAKDHRWDEPSTKPIAQHPLLVSPHLSPLSSPPALHCLEDTTLMPRSRGSVSSSPRGA